MTAARRSSGFGWERASGPRNTAGRSVARHSGKLTVPRYGTGAAIVASQCLIKLPSSAACSRMASLASRPR